MTRWWIALLIVGLGIGGCTSGNTRVQSAPSRDSAADKSSAAADASSKAETEDEDEAEEKSQVIDDELARSKLVRELAVSQEKLTQSRMALAHQEAENRTSVEKAAAELELAQRKLKNLEEIEAALRVEKGQLELQQAKDGFQESGEELAQLEMMYKETDLADKTKEIVITRAQRRLDRAKWALAIEEKDFAHLQSQTLPLELQEARNDAKEKTVALDAAKRSVESDLLDKRIDLMSAEGEVKRGEEELTAHDQKVALRKDKLAKKKAKKGS